MGFKNETTLVYSSCDLIKSGLCSNQKTSLIFESSANEVWLLCESESHAWNDMMCLSSGCSARGSR